VTCCTSPQCLSCQEPCGEARSLGTLNGSIGRRILAPRELPHEIEVIATGDALIAHTIRRLIAEFAARHDPATNPTALDDLTEREREILNLIARGESNPRDRKFTS
jgi:DNA-binding NarL/FixJ family response regulator